MEILHSESVGEKMNSQQNKTIEYEPFQNPEEMTDPERILDYELEMISENPDVLGYNIDSKLIIWPERCAQTQKAKEFLDNGGDIQVLVEEFGQPAERIQEAIERELSKNKLLDDTLSRLPDGVKFRINPHAPLSAFSTANSMRINKKGEKTIHFDDGIMSQIKKIKEKANDSELVVVMNQLHIGKDGKPTSNIPEDATDYINLCKSFVKQSGYMEQSGKGLVLELGNECNMCHSFGGIFESEAFADHPEPTKYADFYYETAKALKIDFPELKLSLTGVAFHDPSFIKQVADRIQARKEQDEVKQKLIDIISFHPYRKTVDEATSVIDGENFDSNDGQSFDSQIEELRKIATPLGAEVTIGEISFYKHVFGESVNENEQAKNAIHGRENGYFSYIWPGEQIVNMV
ncbi:hypothetical protein IJI91_03095 [Candidatus Saccharibacteria bacterium]|nr:hypothetical protein [Candidatus Saccharibacteria bacterium]